MKRFPFCLPVLLLIPPVSAQEGILIFTRTTGFRHASISDGITTVTDLATTLGLSIDQTEDPTTFTDAGLAPYAAVVFLNTTGDVLDETQQAAFERYIQQGGGFMGIHSAADTEYDWPFYGDLVGAYFESHPPGTAEATIRVADAAHPATADLPEYWLRRDEWYNFRDNPRGRVHVLATLDESTYDGGTQGYDHPIAWCHEVEAGRSFYTAGGHTSEAYSEPAFQTHLSGGLAYAAGLVAADCGATLESNFEKVVLETQVVDPIELAVLPDGRVLFIEREGRIRIYNPETAVTTTAGQLDVTTQFEDGLIGVTLDPAFAENNWLYLFYSPAGSEAVQYVSRFTLNDDVLDMASEQQVLTIPVQRDECCHSGGSMIFGPDGLLYIATGDNTNPFASEGYAPIDERGGRSPWDAQKSSANANDLRGKILRIRPEADGSYTIPEGNLFAPDTPGTRPEIYVMGTRNPYRISIDAATGFLYWGDVGPDARTDNPNRGPRGYDEWNQAREAGNFGWPYCIADNKPYRDHDFATQQSGSAFDCAAPSNTSPNNTGATDLPAAQPAWIWYPYGPTAVFPEIRDGGGRTAMAGPIYYVNEDAESERALPPYYDGTLFIYEWARNWIAEVKLDENGDILKINPFLPGLSLKRPIEMEIGPDGSMYMIEWGTGFGGGNADAQLIRIDYVQGQRAPVARFEIGPRSGPVPLAVDFRASDSFDPDGSGLTYAWDFEDDGTVDASEADVTHTYTVPGNYTARLTLEDVDGNRTSATVDITAGNTEPEVRLLSPPSGGVFDWERPVAFEVEVSDAEDGSTVAGTLSCSEVVVQPFLGHDDHTHPLDQFSTCGGTFEAAEPGHGGDGDNLFHVLQATYEDAGGPSDVGSLTARDQVVLQPRRKQAEHFSQNGGTQTEDTGDTVGGGQNIGFIEHNDWTSYKPVSLQGITHITFRVASAGPGGRIEMRADSVSGPLLGVAYVEPTGEWQVYRDVTSSVQDPGYPIELFLVYRNRPGDEGLFNVNFFDFQGVGVSEPEPGRADGLQAVYFDNIDLTGDTLSRIDPMVNFNWSSAAPNGRIDRETFSVRWTGFVQPEVSGRYTFYTRVDDGARLWVNGELVIDEWTDGEVRERSSSRILLNEGERVPITMEYFENEGFAQAHLMWSGPSIPFQTLPRRVLFSGETLPTPTESDIDLPNRLALHAAYPNPFSTLTRIRFDLPEPARVELSVFDLLGRRVATLVDGDRPAGRHETLFDARNLPTGSYLYRLVTPDGFRSGRLVIVR